MNAGAGGGAGGLIFLENQEIPAGTTCTINVGDGGAGGTTWAVCTVASAGNDSSISINGITHTALGGGGGMNSGGYDSVNNKGANGGSGGGAAASSHDCTGNRSGGTGKSGQGYNGGGGYHPGGWERTGGGGGGAGGAGQNSQSSSQAGNGGVGKNMSSYFGTTFGANGWFAGGGGGGVHGGTGGTGGTGGGGSEDQVGVNGTGGGGGAARNGSGAGRKGGSGIVIIRYKNVPEQIGNGNEKQITLKYENQLQKLNYRTTLPIQTIVNINGNTETLNAGTYDIIMDPSGSEIINQATKALIRKYPHTDGNKLIFKYAMSRTLSQLHYLSTTFSGTQYKSSLANEKYSLGTKAINKITKYRIYIYKKHSVNHTIQLYAGDKELTYGTDYTTSGSNQETSAPTINLYNFYITINKTISGAIYLKSNNPIFYIDEPSRTTFNNTADTEFLKKVNGLIGSGLATLTRLNSMFEVTKATTDLADEEKKLISYNITRPSGSHEQITIDYKTNPVSRTSLNNLANTYNTISGYSSTSTVGGIKPILNANFGNILDSAPTDIEEYISYEFPSPPTDTQITPSERTARFNIKSKATKYVYFKKTGVQTPTTSSVQPSIVDTITASNFIGGEPVTGSSDKYEVFKQTRQFTVPPGGLICDILMIGGGAGASKGGGGAGACIVAINQTLPPGSCVVSVGNGGGQHTNGGDSSITVAGTTRYLAKGGGTGGQVNANGASGGCGGGAGVLNQQTTNYDGGSAVATNIVNGNPSIGPSVTSTYAVYGNRGGHQRATTSISPQGGPNDYAYPGGGGGIGSAGKDNNQGNPDAGKGGDGKDSAIINGTTYNFQRYFNNGSAFGHNGFIGGGGGGNNGSGRNTGAHGLTGDTSYNYTPPANSGSGANGASGSGSSGIVIIRYRA